MRVVSLARLEEEMAEASAGILRRLRAFSRTDAFDFVDSDLPFPSGCRSGRWWSHCCMNQCVETSAPRCWRRQSTCSLRVEGGHLLALRAVSCTTGNDGRMAALGRWARQRFVKARQGWTWFCRCILMRYPVDRV